ncbi:MAG TPA: hypothetical protein VGX25_26470 [Actinophytocola sp.]|uniref:hypothetical protein n=1 Tax=Actinophytocola sp. TaxID=1872138 RepID=UPI002DDD4BE5|nr:hypothetical protein [Actinophytocola sp.]HEV2782949.1 hypothetical protein [Actinophytocola sp.]
MSDRPEDVDAAFAAIVADLEREGLGADLDNATERTEDLTHPLKASALEDTDRIETAGEQTAPLGEPTAPIAAWRGHDTEWDWSWGTDDEHYVPPEPPPLPRLRPLTIVALLLVVAGVLLLIPDLIGLDRRIGTPIALLALTSGFGLLFLRIRRTPPTDNGAQV